VTRAKILLRVSTADQHPENQLPTLEQMARARGIDVLEVVVERVSTRRARPELERLLHEAHRGEYDVLLIWAIDRLGRSMIGNLSIIVDLDRKGVLRRADQAGAVAGRGAAGRASRRRRGREDLAGAADSRGHRERPHRARGRAGSDGGGGPMSPWKCSKCRTVVFMPERHNGKRINGGVCTQQRRGCGGELSKMTPEEAHTVRATMAAKGISEQPWLTLVFAAVPS
jgi:hypothetical protein